MNLLTTDCRHIITLSAMSSRGEGRRLYLTTRRRAHCKTGKKRLDPGVNCPFKDDFKPLCYVKPVILPVCVCVCLYWDVPSFISLSPPVFLFFLFVVFFILPVCSASAASGRCSASRELKQHDAHRLLPTRLMISSQGQR